MNYTCVQYVIVLDSKTLSTERAEILQSVPKAINRTGQTYRRIRRILSFESNGKLTNFRHHIYI